MKRVLCGLAFVVAIAASSRAQAVRITQSAGHVTVANSLPARVAVLLIAYGSQGAEDFVTAVVDAGGSTDVRARNRNPYVLARIEPLHPRVGAAASAALACDSRTVGRTLALRADSLRSSLDRLKLEGTAAADQEIAAASALAQVELQQHLDELQLKSFMYHSFRATDTASDWQDTQRRSSEDSQEQRDELIGQMAYTAFAHDEEVQAKLHVLDQQADAMQKVAEQADSAIKLIDGMVRGATVEADGGRALDEVVRHEMLPLLAGNSGTLDDASQPTRVCPSAGMVSDWLQLHATADRSRSIAFAEVRYDNGGSHQVPVRRIAGTDDWVIHLYWPIEAHRATVRLTDAAGHAVSRHVELGHVSLRESADAAHKRLDDLKKKYRSTRFRAEGGDNIKTIIVP